MVLPRRGQMSPSTSTGSVTSASGCNNLNTSPFTAAQLVARVRIHCRETVPPTKIVSVVHYSRKPRFLQNPSLFTLLHTAHSLGTGMVCCRLSAPQTTKHPRIHAMPVAGCNTVAKNTEMQVRKGVGLVPTRHNASNGNFSRIRCFAQRPQKPEDRGAGRIQAVQNTAGARSTICLRHETTRDHHCGAA